MDEFSQTGETLSGWVITTLKSRALLNESPGAGYLERRWPEPVKKPSAWPIPALRQAFLNGTLFWAAPARPSCPNEDLHGIGESHPQRIAGTPVFTVLMSGISLRKPEKLARISLSALEGRENDGE